MRLLIVTQKVDRNDPILGFFHRWLLEFAKQCESVVVIGQLVGAYDLPTNVEVHSLGKERGRSKLGQIVRFWALVWRLRKRYDVVLVHMTPVWIDLGAPVWRVLRKPMYLWYEIRRGGWVLRVALHWVRKVFSATIFGLPSPSDKQVVTGHGIDTEAFHPGTNAIRGEHDIVSIGRVTPIKHFDRLLWAFATLPEQYRFTVAGGEILPSDKKVFQDLRRIIEEHGLEDRVQIIFHLPDDIPWFLQRARLFIHASGGGLDKAVLEAMACGCPVLSCGPASAAVLPPACLATTENFCTRLADTLAMPEAERKALGAQLRETVVRDHSLPRLVRRLVQEMR